MSPIAGLTDVWRLPRIGKLHLGQKKLSERTGKEYPDATPYFVVRADDTTPTDAAMAFWEIYGEEPKELDIIFPTNDPLQWADANYKAYSALWKLRCKGNGETALAKWDGYGKGPRPQGIDSGSWASQATKEWAYMEIPCVGRDCPMQEFSPPKCKMVMNLQFMLPNVRGIGIWQIDTGSKYSVLNVLNNVRVIQTATKGTISGLPLKLRLVPKEVTPKDTATKTVYVLDIYAPITLGQLLKQAASVEERGFILLPSPDDEPPEDLFPELNGEPGPVEPAAFEAEAERIADVAQDRERELQREAQAQEEMFGAESTS